MWCQYDKELQVCPSVCRALKFFRSKCFVSHFVSHSHPKEFISNIEHNPRVRYLNLRLLKSIVLQCFAVSLLCSTPNLTLSLFSLLSTGFFEMKMKYDESDNVIIRASRAVTDKMTDIIGTNSLEMQISDVKILSECFCYYSI